jgi:uncharacterized membrane protein
MARRTAARQDARMTLDPLIAGPLLAQAHAAAALGITGSAGLGRRSLVHLFVPVLALLLPLAVLAARRGRAERHRWTMVRLYLGAPLITGAFMLMPARIMHRVLPGG